MYFQHQHERYCVNLDWLQFSVHLKEAEPEIFCPEGYRIELCQGNNIFKERAMVFDARGAKYMTLLWSPYSKVLPSNLMTIQLANEFLYLPNGQGIKWAWDDLQKIVDCTFNAVGRFDVCIDWEANEQRLEMLKHLNSGHYYCQAKSEGAVWWHETEKDGYKHRQLHCLNWGSPKSEIKVKIYNKSREQGLVGGDEPEKPWIVNEWREAGMDIHNVWRLEFSMAGAGQLRYKGQPITLEMLSNSKWLSMVLLDMYHHRFVTRINQGRRQGHKNQDERRYLLDLPMVSDTLKWAEPKGEDYAIPAAITLLRAMMRQIDNPAIMAARPTFTDYATTILNLIDNHHLTGYFRRTWEADPQEYFNDLWQNVGGGIQHTTPTPRRLMD